MILDKKLCVILMLVTCDCSILVFVP